MISMDYKDWVKQFSPLVRSETTSGVKSLLWDTDSSYLKSRAEVAPNTVWSFVEGDGEDGIVEGMVNNAMGYFITEVPAESGQSYSIEEVK